jgi:hypothetical protein
LLLDPGAARACFSKGNLFYVAFSSQIAKKKLSLARVPIMFKRLFGQPSSSSSSSNRNNNISNNNMGSTSSGRAAFDAVDKLKDVRFCFPLVWFSSPCCPSFDELDETFTRVSFFSLSLFLFCTREVFRFEFARVFCFLFLSVITTMMWTIARVVLKSRARVLTFSLSLSFHFRLWKCSTSAKRSS